MTGREPASLRKFAGIALGKRRYGSVTVSFYVMFFASFGVLPFGIGAVQQMAFLDISGSVWIWVAYIVLFPRSSPLPLPR